MRNKSIKLLALGSILILSTFSFSPPARAVKKLGEWEVDGTTWKLKMKNDQLLRLNKNGKVKCSTKVIFFPSFKACAIDKMGESLYRKLIQKTIGKQIESYYRCLTKGSNSKSCKKL